VIVPVSRTAAQVRTGQVQAAGSTGARAIFPAAANPSTAIAASTALFA
jgi:hypothetical protein